MNRYFFFFLSITFLLSACTPPSALNPDPDSGTPGVKRFQIAAEGYDALLGTYQETFAGNAAYAAVQVQLWSDSETPNRILTITYPGGENLAEGTYRVVGSEADVTDPTAEVIVTYTLAQGTFCTNCTPQHPPVADYYFEYQGTGGTVTITDAGTLIAGELEIEVAKNSYHASLSGTFQAAAGR